MITTVPALYIITTVINVPTWARASAADVPVLRPIMADLRFAVSQITSVVQEDPGKGGLKGQ